MGAIPKLRHLLGQRSLVPAVLWPINELLVARGMG